MKKQIDYRIAKKFFYFECIWGLIEEPKEDDFGRTWWNLEFVLGKVLVEEIKDILFVDKMYIKLLLHFLFTPAGCLTYMLTASFGIVENFIV